MILRRNNIQKAALSVEEDDKRVDFDVKEDVEDFDVNEDGDFDMEEDYRITM